MNYLFWMGGGDSAAGRGGKDVADVPLAMIAQAVGMSRSTLVRRLNGSRQALDEAVRAAGSTPAAARSGSARSRPGRGWSASAAWRR